MKHDSVLENDAKPVPVPTVRALTEDELSARPLQDPTACFAHWQHIAFLATGQVVNSLDSFTVANTVQIQRMLCN